MATLITKNSSTASSVPTNAQLVQGELAVNVTDKRLYTENASGTVVELGTNPGSAVTHTAGTAGAPAITTTGDTNTGIFFPAADTVAASVGGTEGLRLTTTGLGVGTSSPAAKLQVGDGTATTEIRIDGDGGSGNGGFIRGYKDTANPSWFVGDLNPIAGGANSGLCLYSYGATPQVFYTNGSERLRLDSSGNLGLGVTPNTSSAAGKTFQIRNTLIEENTNGYAIWRYNNYFDGGASDRYIANGAAGSFQLAGNIFRWYQAASGTAGNAISFTQAMTLDASGNLGVGTTSISCRGDFRGSSGLGVQFLETSSGNSTRVQLGTSSGVGYINADAGSGSIALGFNVGATERARITSGGDLLVGTTTATEKLTVAGNISINTSGNPFLQIRTSGSGNNPYVRLQADTNYWDVQGTFSNAGDELYFNYNGNARAYINSATGAYTAVSDQRLKKDITDISYGLSAVMALRPVEYLMRDEPDDAQKHLGFIAQEALEVVPSSVSLMTGDTYGMDKTEIVAVLVKAIQELKAEFDAYKATHP